MGGVGPGGPGAGGSEGGSSGGVASRAAGRQPLPSSALARPASPSGAGALRPRRTTKRDRDRTFAHGWCLMLFLGSSAVQTVDSVIATQATKVCDVSASCLHWQRFCLKKGDKITNLGRNGRFLLFFLLPVIFVSAQAARYQGSISVPVPRVRRTPLRGHC